MINEFATGKEQVLLIATFLQKPFSLQSAEDFNRICSESFPSSKKSKPSISEGDNKSTETLPKPFRSALFVKRILRIPVCADYKKSW